MSVSDRRTCTNFGEKAQQNRPIPNEELDLKNTFNGARATARGYGQPTHQQKPSSGLMAAHAPVQKIKDATGEDDIGSSRGIPPKAHMRGQGGRPTIHVSC